MTSLETFERPNDGSITGAGFSFLALFSLILDVVNKAYSSGFIAGITRSAVQKARGGYRTAVKEEGLCTPYVMSVGEICT